MTKQILDCATPVSAGLVQQVKQAGYAGVGRYLNQNSFKTLTPAEVKLITSAGLSIVSIWESNPTTATYFTPEQGARDAQEAVRAAQSLSQPPGTPIYLTCDYDAQKPDYIAIQAYLDAAVQHIAPYVLGFYADYDVLSIVRGVQYLWQTVAWSHGQVLTNAKLYQRNTDVSLFGHNFDVDDVLSNPGWWPTPKEPIMQKYDAVKALVDGKPVKAVGVVEARTEVTHLIWTVARDTGCNLTKVEVDDVEIDGRKPAQVFDGTDTYLRWSEIPSLDTRPEPLPGGGFNFLTLATHPHPLPGQAPAPTPTTAPAPTPSPAPVETHNYTLVVYENDSAVAGEWVTISIETKDNGKPLGNQTVVFTENGQNPQTAITDATTGGYGWGINETTATTDTMEFKWTDPAGVLHTVTKTTAFTIPQSSDAPVPADDNVVVRIPMLPDSDPSNAVFFNMTAPNGETIKCQLDTGAFEPMFTTDSAKILGLQNLGAVSVQGIGGSASAYYSEASFSLNGVSFSQVPCVVEDAYTGYPLFGYRFFVDNGYDLLVSQKHNEIVVMKGAN